MANITLGSETARTARTVGIPAVGSYLLNERLVPTLLERITRFEYDVNSAVLPRDQVIPGGAFINYKIKRVDETVVQKGVMTLRQSATAEEICSAADPTLFGRKPTARELGRAHIIGEENRFVLRRTFLADGKQVDFMKDLYSAFRGRVRLGPYRLAVNLFKAPWLVSGVSSALIGALFGALFVSEEESRLKAAAIGFLIGGITGAAYPMIQYSIPHANVDRVAATVMTGAVGYFFDLGLNQRFQSTISEISPTAQQ